MHKAPATNLQHEASLNSFVAGWWFSIMFIPGYCFSWLYNKLWGVNLTFPKLPIHTPLYKKPITATLLPITNLSPNPYPNPPNPTNKTFTSYVTFIPSLILTFNTPHDSRVWSYIIPRENELRERIPVPQDNFFKIYLKFARVLRRLFLSVVSVTRVVYFHVNVTCFSAKQCHVKRFAEL